MIPEIPEFVFEWIALNPAMAKVYVVVFSSICAVAVLTGYFLENRYFKKKEIE